MEWRDVGDLIGKAAPLIGSLFGPAGTAVGGIVASALGVNNDPESIANAVKNNPDALIKLRQIELDHEKELRKMQFDLAIAELNSDTQQQSNVSDTYKTEVQSEDAYVRRWRPTMGYAVTAVWSLLGIGLFAAMIAVVVLLFQDPSAAAQLIPLLGSALADMFNAVNLMFVSAFAVLGVYVKKRSDDKMSQSGGESAGLFDSLAKRFRK